jgi:hypothetical protein
MQNMHPKFYCEYCDYSSSRKSLWNQHITTAKHLKAKNGEAKANKKYACEHCNIIFKHQSSYCRHQKKCNANISSNSIDDENITETDSDIETNTKAEITSMTDKELIMMLLKQNAELLEIVKNGTNNIITTNSHNKTFNLQIFLNETCKDAMNIMDFVDQIVLNLNDLEETGRLGFAEGISKMILKRLKTLDVTQRPIHCSDLKRETLYIKDENKWEKEDETKPKLTKAVKEISAKNIRQIKDWQKKHPDYNDPESKTSDKYMNMVMNVMAGGTQEEIQENYEKIIKNITKETTIAKENFLV